MASVAFRFERHRKNVPSAPKHVNVIAPGKNASQPCHLSVHQSNMATPTLNQIAALMKLPSKRQKIVWSHAHTVRQKLNQKNNTMGMRTAARKPISSPTLRIAPMEPGEAAAIRAAGTG